MKDTNSIELIDLLMQAVNEKGVEKTKNILKKGLEEGNETQDRISGFIIKCVCKNFNISENELFLGRSRKYGSRTKARAMLIYMLKCHLYLSQAQISKILRINKSLTSRDLSYMNNLNPKFPEEKKQLKKKVKINNEIIVFVENNK